VTAAQVRCARIYDDASGDDGHRVLVDRLWPRGMRKDRAPIDEWLKDVAPSTELRHWYGHDPDKYGEFAERYRAELRDPARAAAVAELADRTTRETVTLLTATKEVDLSHLTVLADVLRETARRR
jgi:uncharacterized protein YeaO (DUF488 family)